MAHFDAHGMIPLIRDVANNNLAITARTDGTVQLDKASDSGNAA